MKRIMTPAKDLFGVLAAAALAAMMFLTALDVGLRYLANRPIPGGLELVEYLMAILVPFAVAVTAYNGTHIGVDLIMARAPRSVRKWIGVVTHLMMAVLFGVITWQSGLNIAEQFDSGLTSAVLRIPHYPFAAALTVAFALLTLIVAMQLVGRLRGDAS